MGKDTAAIRAQRQPRLDQMARELGRAAYPDGLPRDTKFSELEALAGALGDEIARRLIEANVSEQADGWPEAELGECPVRGGPARKAPDKPRQLQATRGSMAWKERVGNCPRCRRAFSPRTRVSGFYGCPRRWTKSGPSRRGSVSWGLPHLPGTTALRRPAPWISLFLNWPPW